jgi:protocatechuate 3,4-dioxygenase, beta subunit
VLDEGGRPVRNTLVEIWQANSAGRYVQKTDQHAAPLDPNFLGAGRCLTDNAGRYRFLTIKPGAYPWGNHANAWRPNHIHFSLFGDYFGSRLVTQMYFPGDPLLELDPIFKGTPEHTRALLISRFSLDQTEEGFALGYEFDIVLRGAKQTPTEA